MGVLAICGASCHGFYISSKFLSVPLMESVVYIIIAISQMEKLKLREAE